MSDQPVRFEDERLLAERLVWREETAALLWDMDGVLLDSLSMDYDVVRGLIDQHLPGHGPVSRALIRELFPLALPDFWLAILMHLGIDPDDGLVATLIASHADRRRTTTVAVHDGVPEVLRAAHDEGLLLAVVSSNPRSEIEAMLQRAGLRSHFDAVVGDDGEGIKRKPAPDAYLEAARRLSVGPSACTSIEDSLLGARAAWDAGCYSLGVATGAATFAELSQSPCVTRAYTGLAVVECDLLAEGSDLRISTPLEEVDALVLDLAERLGCGARVAWTSDDWRGLGERLGREACRRVPDARARFDGGALPRESKAEDGRVSGLVEQAVAGVADGFRHAVNLGAPSGRSRRG
jgi:HAD superfamily hydrolase (TIGR01509 family)